MVGNREEELGGGTVAVGGWGMGEIENRRNKLIQVDIRRYGESARTIKDAEGLERGGAVVTAQSEREGTSSEERSGRYRRKRDRDEAGAQGLAELPEGKKLRGNGDRGSSSSKERANPVGEKKDTSIGSATMWKWPTA